MDHLYMPGILQTVRNIRMNTIFILKVLTV